MSARGRVAWTAAAALAAWCVAYVGVQVAHLFDQPGRHPELARQFRPPHHVPEHAGGVPFRFAMAHDVIHERFAKHGLAYYRERDRVVREKLAALAPDDPATFPLLDDLAVGVERLGRSDEAASIIRDKLARQTAKGLGGRDLYTSYANLGTFLIHGSFAQAAAGDPAARERLREGVGFIRKSVEVNPAAHFGRERWQAAIAEFLLAAMDDPTLLEKYDCVGNRLDLPLNEIMGDRRSTGYGRPYDMMFAEDTTFQRDRTEEGLGRAWITKVGAEEGWEGVDVPSHRARVPFDEPALGIIGMWRQGGGANPHFALALGETMLRVGQRSIAWSAFERASRLAGRYSTIPEIQAFLRAHCYERQAEIERRLDPNSPIGDRLRSAFDAELAHGQGYQEDFQDYEAARIAAGGSIEDEHFLDDFPRRDEAIASPSGREERADVTLMSDLRASVSERARAVALFASGIAAFATSALLGLRPGRRRKAGGPGVEAMESVTPTPAPRP
ncbi:hypothetical protein [Paludisphaera sp.]|uniref:hypothetical protein n=1 Tax=Paludisphaera sp. TaxID=2017432 RepID=UPI00301CC694